MRDIWFVDSVDAEAFHIYPDCAALEQAVQPVVAERVSGLAEIVETAHAGELHPCTRCRIRAESEIDGEAWSERLIATGWSAEDALEFLTQGAGPSKAMLKGDEPLREFQQNLVKLKIFTDRFEIKPFSLLGGAEPAVIPFAEVSEVRAVGWIPLVRAPAIEIDSEFDGEGFTNRFEMSILDTPKMVVAAVEDVMAASQASASSTPNRSGTTAFNGFVEGQGGGARQGGGGSTMDYGKGIRGELAQLYDEGKKNGGAFHDGSGADLGGPSMSGWDFADGVMAGCNDAESLKNLAERLEEAVRMARFFVEANAISTTNPKRWNKLVVSIGDCDIDWELEPYEPGGPGDPFRGGGGGGGKSAGPPEKPGGGNGTGDGGGNGGGRPKRSKKDEEAAARAWVRRNLNKKYADNIEIIIRADKSEYNCYGAALGVFKNIQFIGEDGTVKDGALSVIEFDIMLAANGFVADDAGNVEFDVWQNDAGIVHVSKILGPKRHESKFGTAGPHIIHDPAAFEGNKAYKKLRYFGKRKGYVVRDHPKILPIEKVLP